MEEFSNINKINSFFKYKRGEYVTSETIRFVLEELEKNKEDELELIQLCFPKYRDYYILSYYVKCNEECVGKDIIIHKRCDLSSLMSELKRKFNYPTKYEYLVDD